MQSYTINLLEHYWSISTIIIASKAIITKSIGKSGAADNLNKPAGSLK